MGPPPIMQRGQSLRQQVFPEKSGYLSGSHTRRPEIRLRLVSTNKGLKQMYRIRVRRGSAYLLSLMKGVWLGSLRTELAKVRNVKQARGDREIATWPVCSVLHGSLFGLAPIALIDWPVSLSRALGGNSSTSVTWVPWISVPLCAPCQLRVTWLLTV